MFKAELTRREDALADVLGVVNDALVHILTIQDTILLVDFAIIITEYRVEQMLVLFSFISDKLSTAERVE